jgi:hypothetical protein
MAHSTLRYFTGVLQAIQDGAAVISGGLADRDEPIRVGMLAPLRRFFCAVSNTDGVIRATSHCSVLRPRGSLSFAPIALQQRCGALPAPEGSQGESSHRVGAGQFGLTLVMSLARSTCMVLRKT